MCRSSPSRLHAPMCHVPRISVGWFPYNRKSQRELKFSTRFGLPFSPDRSRSRSNSTHHKQQVERYPADGEDAYDGEQRHDSLLFPFSPLFLLVVSHHHRLLLVNFTVHLTETGAVLLCINISMITTFPSILCRCSPRYWLVMMHSNLHLGIFK